MAARDALLISHTDGMNFPAGGITSHCREFLLHAALPEALGVVGVTVDPSTRVGTWQAFPSRPEVAFLPLYRSSPSRYLTRRIPFKAHVLPRLIVRLPELLSSHVVYTHNVELTVPFLTARRGLPRVVMAIHGHGGFTSLNRAHLFRFRAFRRAYSQLEDWALDRVDDVVVVSREGQRYYEARYPHLGARLHLVGNGVDVDTFTPASKSDARVALGLDSSMITVAWAGRVSQAKDPLLALRAFKALATTLPDSQLLIAGDGELMPDVKRFVREEGLRNVTLFGEVAPSRLARIYQAADVFLLTSAWEGMPMALLEALSSGRPAVTTRVGECSELIQDGITGFVCETRSPAEIADRLREAASLDSVEQCRAVARANSAMRMARRLSSVLGIA